MNSFTTQFGVSTENSGLGTTTPASYLSVAGNLTVGASLAGTTAAPANGLLVAGNSWLQGNLGIGTSNPQQKLQLNGGNISLVASDNPALQSPSGHALGGLFFYGHGRTPANDSAKITCGSNGWDDAGFLDFCTSPDANASTSRMRITETGKIGVGTAAPAGKMHVVTAPSDGIVGAWDNGQFVVGQDGPNGGAIGLSYNTSTNTSTVSSLSPGLSWRPLAFRVQNAAFYTNGGSEVLRIQENNCVGIGTASPQAPLSIGFAAGKEGSPDASLHLTNDCLLFGGNNAGREANSAQISAGKHIADSLCIVGMSNAALANRRVDMWAEGGFNLYGNLGIGTTSAAYPIHVARASMGSIPAYYYMNRIGTGAYGGTFTGVSIWASDRVVAAEFNAISDARIKKNVSLSAGDEDLARLRGIKIHNYQYQDSVGKGNGWQKGFIAQQVQEIFPEAVHTHTEFVPDIYAQAERIHLNEGTLHLTMAEAHHLTTGDIVRIISDNGMAELAVKVEDGKTFSVAGWEHDSERIFVYGKQVDDFLAVDYNRIYSLNVSATQALERQVAALQAQVEMLMQAQK